MRQTGLLGLVVLGFLASLSHMPSRVAEQQAVDLAQMHYAYLSSAQGTRLFTSEPRAFTRTVNRIKAGRYRDGIWSEHWEEDRLAQFRDHDRVREFVEKRDSLEAELRERAEASAGTGGISQAPAFHRTM